MSVRAYKIVVPAELSNEPAFNLWHDEKLTAWLEENTDFYEMLGDDGSGDANLTVKDIKKILKLAKKLELGDYEIKQFKEDIAGLSDEDTVTYSCF